ncbi:MAG: tetratricopeptide repeat protein [Planctomycetota bacterium]|jgi:tetratricopeptide (TPR) repeat protein
MNQPSDKRHIFLIYLALTLITIGVFHQVHNYEFLSYDDPDYVSANKHVRAGLTTDSIIWACTTGYFSYWHPLTWLSHMLDCDLFGVSPGWHHLTNLFLHVANTLLLFAVLKLMTAALWRSAFVAALFALHPLHVESVAWIAERKDVLSTLFWLLTMAAYIRYVRSPSLKWYLLTILAFAMGLMAKPMLVTLPFTLLLLDYWPLARFKLGQTIKDTDWKVLYRLFTEKIPLFIIAAVTSVITFIVPRGSGAVPGLKELTLIPRLTNALISYAKYIEKMFWPSRLAVFYPRAIEAFPTWRILAAVVLLLVITSLAVRLARTRKYLLVGWLWYVGILVPVIGLVQVGDQAMADRYTYVSLIGLFIIITWGLNDLLGKSRYHKIVLAASAVPVIVALSICSYFQQQHWRNSGTIFQHAINVTEGNYVAHSSLAYFLHDQGKIDQAIAHSAKSLQIRPNYVNAHIALGRALLEADRIDEAIKCFNTALKFKPDFDLAYVNLGVAYVRQGKFDQGIIRFAKALEIEPECAEAHNNIGVELARRGNLEEAIKHYKEALRIKPGYPEVYVSLGEVFLRQGKLEEAFKGYSTALQINPEFAEAHKVQGKVLLLQGRFADAVEKYKQVLLLQPDNPASHNDLGVALSLQGKSDEAIVHFKEALRLDPNSAPAHFILARALTGAGTIDQAVTHLEETLRIKPNWPDPMNNLARLSITHKKAGFYNPNQALKLAERACKLTNYNRPDFLDTLAAAYAETGRFEKAVDTAQKALKLALSSGQAKLAEKIKNSLSLYKAGKPYAEPLPKAPSN